MMATRNVPKLSAAAAVASMSALSSCYAGVEPSEGANASTTTEATGTVSGAATVGVDGSSGEGPSERAYGFEELAFPGMASVPAIIVVDTPDGPVEVDHLLYENGYGVLDGDIILYTPVTPMMQIGEMSRTATMPAGSASDAGSLASTRYQHGGVISLSGLRWPGGIIPYVLDDDLPEPDEFLEAVQHWEENTPIRLVPRTTEDDYVLVLDKGGCFSHMGKGGGVQELGLASGCDWANAVHEIGHAAGLYHEQKRNDQMLHVDVNEENIHPKQRNQFNPYFANGVDVGEYDLGSRMHYSSCAFSICTNDDGTECLDQGNGSQLCSSDRPEGECICTVADASGDDPYPGCSHCNCFDDEGDCLNPSITRLDGTTFVSQRNGLSSGDIAAVNFLYGQCADGADGLYCGGSIGLDEFTLYECVGGQHTAVEICAGCVVQEGADDVCPDAGSCPDGDGLYCGAAVGLNVGALYSCVAGEYSLAEACAYECSIEAGSNDQCIDQCSTGDCCANGLFSLPDVVCTNDGELEYGCPWGTAPGDDVGVRYRDRYCSGSDADCSGGWGPWEMWQTQDTCSVDEVCVLGDSTCNSVPACGEASAWNPSSMSSVEWEQTGGVQQLEFEVQEVSGDEVRFRACKVGGGPFLNDIDVYFEEWVKYVGFQIHDGPLTSTGSMCSQWAYVDTSAWNEGEGLGGEVRVVSPDTCAGVWGQWCGGPDPGCGYCWFINTSVMTRTCLPS